MKGWFKSFTAKGAKDAEEKKSLNAKEMNFDFFASLASFALKLLCSLADFAAFAVRLFPRA